MFVPGTKQENITSLHQRWDLTKNSSPDAQICTCGRVLVKHHCHLLRTNCREHRGVQDLLYSTLPCYTAQGRPATDTLLQQPSWPPSPTATMQTPLEDTWKRYFE